ncbi:MULTISPECIES: hypothetical protein [Mycobacterium avium complex (MAC)]|uniref:Uncharacterized protein n=2 Tax=Mycobacterium avium TaxID=1764 RepID=A0A187NDS0_MYCAV|nr:hypothetical protein [Mycobacterium avium]AKT73029.1 hypothetical protein MASH_00028 [Mycobacterium avium subsp. hominissuis]MBZ4522188.1 hypothetical protein [Mycobacterium avium subsp. hominissuis]MDO2354310.1 hypothetical protein [Mycobacterium avium subsp. hominissuis]
MSNHIEWGHAAHSLYTLHPRERAIEELQPDDEDELTAPFVLGLWNENGDGLAVQGTRREILDYLGYVIAHVQRETDPRLELDQALKRLETLREQRSAVLENANYRTCDLARLDDVEVDLLNDVAAAAAEVNDQL